MERKTSLKRKPSTLVRKPMVKKASKRPSKRKKTQVAMWAEYGLKKPVYVRYSGLGGILWWVTSQYVRKTEFEQYGGKCVDNCGVPILDWHDADCGHFRSARSLTTRFLRENLAIQRKHCNSTRKGGGNGRQYDFGKEIDRRYGTGKADQLTELAAQTATPFKDSWYDSEIRRILALLGTVDNEQKDPTPEV